MARRGRRRRRGIFEGYPRVVYRRTGARYIDACVLAVVLNGVAVACFGVVTLVLYVDVSAGELGLFAACSVAWYAIEGLVAGVYLRGAALPVRAWLAGERHDDATQQAWLAAARLPLVLLRRPSLYAIGAAGAAGVSLAVAAMLERPAYEAALLFPAFYLLYVYSAVLRYLGLELTLRPVLEAVGERLPVASPADFAEVSLHRRLLATVPIVTWGAGVVVAGLLTENTRDFDTLGLASVVAIAVTAVVSIWVSLVLADSVSGPIIDLRDATRRVGAGDLDVRVPVVCTDETGELAASFNAMVAGLGAAARGAGDLRRSGADRARARRGHGSAGRGARRLGPVPRRARVHRVRRARRSA